MDRETKLNIIRGCIIGSYLPDETKRELAEFISELEDRSIMVETSNDIADDSRHMIID